MIQEKLLGITLPNKSKKDILEEIIKFIRSPKEMLHIVSLNPENIVIALEDERFKKVVETTQIKIIDGVGIVIASRMLNLPIGERVTGVGLMEEMLQMVSRMRLRVLLIGGRHDLANKIAKCQSEKFPEANFRGITGIADIKKPQEDEEDQIFSIVSRFKPHFVFVSFGSPAQELWIDRHKKEFYGCVVMGVGGAFDYLGGTVGRAPAFMQKIGFEWLFRLLNEPWRWRRQLRLVKFMWLVWNKLF